VSTRKRKLSNAEVQRGCAGDANAAVPPILSPHELAAMLHLSVKTIYEWISKGRLDGAFRKRGKHVLIWRDRALDIIFNGPEWNS
jgi:excisionase family DNA binding protein